MVFVQYNDCNKAKGIDTSFNDRVSTVFLKLLTVMAPIMFLEASAAHLMKGLGFGISPMGKRVPIFIKFRCKMVGFEAM